MINNLCGGLLTDLLQTPKTAESTMIVSLVRAFPSNIQSRPLQLVGGF